MLILHNFIFSFFPGASARDSFSEKNFRLYDGFAGVVESRDAKHPLLRLFSYKPEVVPFMALAEVSERKLPKFPGAELLHGKAIEAIIRITGVIDVHIMIVFRIGDGHCKTPFPFFRRKRRNFPTVHIQRPRGIIRRIILVGESFGLQKTAGFQIDHAPAGRSSPIPLCTLCRTRHKTAASARF